MLVLAEPSHTFVIELVDPFDKNCGFVESQNVEARGSASVWLIALGAVRIGELVMLKVTFQGFNLCVESSSLTSVGLLGLMNNADSSTQYSPEDDGIKGRYIIKKGVQ